jgi:phage baseplate assembly protein gpV
MSTNTHRAIVTQANAATGDIRVRIPAKFGSDTALDISRVGRKATNGVWHVPNVGEQIVVTSDDDSFTNIFWVQVDNPVVDLPDLADLADVDIPTPSSGSVPVWDSAINKWVGTNANYAAEAITLLTINIDGADTMSMSSTGSITTGSNVIFTFGGVASDSELQSYKDASFLGIFR